MIIPPNLWVYACLSFLLAAEEKWLCNVLQTRFKVMPKHAANWSDFHNMWELKETDIHGKPLATKDWRKLSWTMHTYLVKGAQMMPNDTLTDVCAAHFSQMQMHPINALYMRTLFVWMEKLNRRSNEWGTKWRRLRLISHQKYELISFWLLFCRVTALESKLVGPSPNQSPGW